MENYYLPILCACFFRDCKRGLGGVREREMGLKVIKHQVKYRICHGSTENLIIPHKEWMCIWYASHNTFKSNEYFMILPKKVSVLD